MAAADDAAFRHLLIADAFSDCYICHTLIFSPDGAADIIAIFRAIVYC